MTDEEWSTFHDPGRPSLFQFELYAGWFYDKIFQVRDKRMENYWWIEQKELEIAAAKRAFESILNGYAK